MYPPLPKHRPNTWDGNGRHSRPRLTRSGDRPRSVLSPTSWPRDGAILVRCHRRSTPGLRRNRSLGALAGPVIVTRPLPRRPVYAIQRASQILEQGGIWARDGRGPRDHDIVHGFADPFRKYVLDRRLEAPAGAVARHRVANFFTRGKPDSRTRSGDLGQDRGGLQNQTRRDRLQSPTGDSQKFRSYGQTPKRRRGNALHGCPVMRRLRTPRVQALSLARPRERRARRTRRPPTVAMRDRNPCRRLRTRTLG